MISTINRFDGQYKFLSNFDMASFPWRGVLFKSGEHAFSYAKCWHLAGNKMRMEEYRAQILDAPTPAKAKYHGRSLPLDVDGWDERKVHYMREIVHAKFGYVKDYAGKLINTGMSPLVEGNDWGDKFWGKVMENGKVIGLNMLGTILMEERGYWLWYGQANFDVLSSPLTVEQAERTLL
jgi:hypothetical protein